MTRAGKAAKEVKPPMRAAGSRGPSGPEKQSARGYEGRGPIAFDLARIRFGAGSAAAGTIGVSLPGDACEREAERVSRGVLREDVPRGGGFAPSGAVRQEARTMPQAGGWDGEAALSGGSPMPKELRTFFEPRLGYDLSRVRLHHGEDAAGSARAVEARAFARGRDIVFGRGEYAPHTTAGRRLLAHELVHVVQQGRAGGGGNVLMRTPLDQVSEADRQSLKVDTDVITGPQGLSGFFGLKGTPVLAANVTDSYEFETPMVDAVKDPKVKADLMQGLRLFALSRFDLIPDATGKASSRRLHQVHLESLDLTRFGGPNAMFRFTSIGSDNKKGAITVRILIEEVAAPVKPMVDPAATADVERRKVVPYGLKRGASVEDPVWQRILRSLGTIDESLVMRVRDITFEVSGKQLGPSGEPADFDYSFKAGPWVKTITLFQKMLSTGDAEFATLVAHELGHAVDAAPAEKPGGKIANGEAHNLPEFKEAAKKDGGRAHSITQYGTTNDSEFYAECLSLFVQQPDTLRALRPNIYLYFFKYEWAAVRDAKLNAPSLFWSSSRKPVP